MDIFFYSGLVGHRWIRRRCGKVRNVFFIAFPGVQVLREIHTVASSDMESVLVSQASFGFWILDFGFWIHSKKEPTLFACGRVEGRSRQMEFQSLLQLGSLSLIGCHLLSTLASRTHTHSNQPTEKENTQHNTS